MNDFSVVLGSNDPIRTNEGIERKISRLVLHPKFIFRQAYFDFALIEMDEEVEFTLTIHPVCLPGEILEDIDLRDGRLVDIGMYEFNSKTGYIILNFLIKNLFISVIIVQIDYFLKKRLKLIQIYFILELLSMNFHFQKLCCTNVI